MRYTLLKGFKAWLAAVGLVVIAGGNLLHAQESASPAAPQVAPSAIGARSVPATADMEEYKIGPSDLLELSVFGIQEMTRVVRVNAQGMISLPLLGTIRAGGLSANELEVLLAEKLSENLLQNPQVSVFIKEFVSQRVVVEGSVMKTGVYPLTGKTSLMQVLAIAGGLNPIADPTNVKIFREKQSGTREVHTFDLVAIRAGKVEDPLIKGNDTVVVEESASAALLKGVTDTLRGFVGFGTLR
jgi:polysaccharide biosynthesis/export protein